MEGNKDGREPVRNFLERNRQHTMLWTHNRSLNPSVDKIEKNPSN